MKTCHLPIIPLLLCALASCQNASESEAVVVSTAEALEHAAQLNAQGEFEAALVQLQPVIHSKAASEEVWMTFGAAEEGLAHFEKAAFAYGRAYKLSQDPHPSIFAAANAWTLAGNLTQAQQFYDLALSKEPNSVHEFLAAANISELRQDIDGALKRVKSGLQQEAGNVDLEVRLAHLLVLTGDLPGAKVLLSAVRQADTEHLGAVYGEIEWAIASNSGAKALELAKDIYLKLPGEPETHLWLARANFIGGDRSGATKLVASGLELAGDCTCTAELRGQLQELDVLLKTSL